MLHWNKIQQTFPGLPVFVQLIWNWQSFKMQLNANLYRFTYYFFSWYTYGNNWKHNL